MMIDMNGPDIEALDEVKSLILESVNAWKKNTKWTPSRSSAGVTRPSRSAQGRSNVYSQLSRLEKMWVSMISSRIISFQKVMVELRQVLHPFLTLYPWRQTSRRSTASGMSVMFLKHWVTNEPSHQPNGVCPKGPLFFDIPKSDSHADMHLQQRFSECSKQCYDRGLFSAMTGLVSAMTAV